jgi:hypothetical protein
VIGLRLKPVGFQAVVERGNTWVIKLELDQITRARVVILTLPTCHREDWFTWRILDRLSALAHQLYVNVGPVPQFTRNPKVAIAQHVVIQVTLQVLAGTSGRLIPEA